MGLVKRNTTSRVVVGAFVGAIVGVVGAEKWLGK
jgi:uncharacterized membrane protein